MRGTHGGVRGHAQGIRQKEMDITRDRINCLLKAGANVFLTTKGMDDLSIKSPG